MRVVVIGAGLSGLAAAAFAARAGHDVVVLDKASAFGGRAATHQHEGFAMNLGAHALYRGGPAERALTDLGVVYGGKPPAVGGYALAGGKLRGLPVGFVSLLATSLLSLRSKLDVAKLLAGVADIDAERMLDRSIAAWVDGAVQGEDARAYLRAMMRLTTYSADHERFSAGVAIATLQRVVRENVIYLDGGWSTLVRGIEAVGRREGVRFSPGVRVAGVVRERGRVARVELADGAMVAADAVIAAVSPKAAAKLFAVSPSLGRVASEAVPCHAACFDVALSRLPSPRTTFALGVDEPTYFSVHSAVARLAPDGGALVHLAYYRASEEPRTDAEIERALENVLDALQPGWRDLVVARQYLPKLVVTNAIPLASTRGLEGRPSVHLPEIDGAFIAGDWVGPDGCLADAALGSARAAAALLGTGRSTSPRAASPTARAGL